MYLQTTIIAIVMVATFALASWKLKSPEISMVITAIVGALVGGFGFPSRLLVEGMFTYFDVGLIFLTASIFINIYSETGAMNALVRWIVKQFYDKKWLMLILLGILLIIPGALTGAGSVSIFVVGGLVSSVMNYMGFSKKRIAAFIYLFAMLAAVAPPINLWAMLMAAQANMPYVGFGVVLIVPIIIIAAFTILYTGLSKTPGRKTKTEILEELPQPPAGMNWFKILVPFGVLLVLILLMQYATFYIPVLGLPLTFMICAFISMGMDKDRWKVKKWYNVMVKTVDQVFPLLGTVISVGVLVNIMTATGVKGLLAITFITLPMAFIYITALIFAPFAQGSLSYGSAIILGTPIIFLFNSMGLNVTVTAAALSFLFPLGDCLPPSRIVGRLTIETVGYEGSYMSFLKAIAIPWLFMGAIGLLMLLFPNQLRFLVVY
ncbi:MAG: citrate transporter [Thermotogaceae bacterium]|jgi:TRAP-type C4-dicarboxylate transport system permease large subunit|nr:citrate transporter [Mesotoga sp.]MDI9376503.1 citrate transporter [Thermotogota bacterium]NLX34060.1 citrate transporter [Thermotogaceae bacterium]MDD4039689.1 citrate transporter [Mesotoga sp.]HOI64528.1 citrate transporter [Mesotoga sp.]